MNFQSVLNYSIFFVFLGGKPRRQGGSYQQQTRATLSWRKDEDDDTGKKKVKKQNGAKKEDSEEVYDYIDEIPPEKVFSCAVSLAEINRKLGVVMWKPSD